MSPQRTRRGTLLIAGQFGFLIALAVYPAPATESGLAQGIGYSLFGIAALLLVLAFIPLRPSLTVRPEPKEGPLIVGGIYTWIRHPMYTAVMIIGVGLYLTKPSIVMMILLIALMYVMFTKATYEDALLRAKWPQAREYQRRVGMFLPKPRSR